MIRKEEGRENYTKVMEEVVNDSIQQFNYAREDLQSMYEEVCVAKKAIYEGRLRNELILMLEKSYPQLASAPDYLLKLRDKLAKGEEAQLAQVFDDWIFGMTSDEFEVMIRNVPTRKELIILFFQKLYSIYEKAPTPDDYMRRLVLRLADDDVKKGNHSVRMMILKQFLINTSYETENVFDALRSGNQEVEERELIDLIPESIFDCITRHGEEINIQRGQKNIIKLAAAVVERIYEDIKRRDEEEIVEKAKRVITENAKKTLGYILEPFGNERKRSVRLVAKPIVNGMIIARDEGKEEEEIKNEGVESAKKEVKEIIEKVYKSRRDRYTLLKLADDLASGKFRTSGRTRTDLYMFAMTFNMTVSLGRKEEYDPETDVEKNLFHDYYNDNLLRYLTSEYQERKKEFEREPTGEGINYKNFAEVIYLYYIRKKNMNAQEKIEGSQELIMQCLERAQAGAIIQDQLPEENTEIYRRGYIEKAMYLNEEELIDYLCTDYYISATMTGVVSQVGIARHTNAASQIYAEKIEDIGVIDEYIDLRDQGGPEALQDHKNFDASVDFDLIETGYNNDENFMKLLMTLDDKLRELGRYSLRDLKKVVRITRTQLIGLFYYYHRTDLQKEGKVLPLQDLYSDFCISVNTDLEKSRFQRISEKNIFDMFIIFVLYYEQLERF
jgi:hypothetical protein